jgi:hypothetical protein
MPTRQKSTFRSIYPRNHNDFGTRDSIRLSETEEPMQDAVRKPIHTSIGFPIPALDGQYQL